MYYGRNPNWEKLQIGDFVIADPTNYLESINCYGLLKIIKIEKREDADPLATYISISNGKSYSCDITWLFRKEDFYLLKDEHKLLIKEFDKCLVTRIKDMIKDLENYIEELEKQELFAFWRYDLPPYFLGGKVIEVIDNERVRVKGWDGYIIKPYKTCSYEMGKNIYYKILKINKENQEKMDKIKLENKTQIDKLILRIE